MKYQNQSPETMPNLKNLLTRKGVIAEREDTSLMEEFDKESGYEMGEEDPLLN